MSLIKKSIIYYAIFLVIIFGLLARKDFAWMYSEGAAWSLLYVLSEDFTKIDLSFGFWKDLKRIFWFESRLDGGQFRIITAFFQMVDARLRSHAFSVIPPHLTISLSWILAFAVIPALLFKVLKNLFPDLNVFEKMVCAVLFVVSGASIGSVFQYYHPGKILSVVVFTAALAMTPWVLAAAHGSAMRIKRLFWLGATLFSGLFIDPYCVVNYVAVPLLYPEIVGGKKFYRHLRSWNYVWLVAFSVVLYVSIVKYFLPWLSLVAGEPVAFLQHIETGHAKQVPIFNIFSPKFYLLQIPNLYLQIGYAIGFLQTEQRSFGLPMFMTPAWGFIESALSWAVTSAVAGLFFWGMYRLWKLQSKSLVPRVLLVFLAAMVGNSLIHSYCDIILPHGSYFYGCMTAIPLAMIAGLVLSSFPSGSRSRKNALIALILVTLSSGVSTFYINWRFVNFRMGSPEPLIEITEKVRRDWWTLIRTDNKELIRPYCEVPEEVSSRIREEKSQRGEGEFSTLHTKMFEHTFYRYVYFGGFCD